MNSKVYIQEVDGHAFHHVQREPAYQMWLVVKVDIRELKVRGAEDMRVDVCEKLLEQFHKGWTELEKE